jgi:hypothetical protein
MYRYVFIAVKSRGKIFPGTSQSQDCRTPDFCEEGDSQVA